MKSITSKSGKILKGRLYELYTGNCPSESPCSSEEVEKYRQMFDQLPADTPRKPGTKRNKHWKFAGQLFSYVEAKMRWTLAGCPVPTPEQLKEREDACHSCTFWDHKSDGCNVCGCGIDGGSLAEKRSMATEECPADPPRWKSLI